MTMTRKEKQIERILQKMGSNISGLSDIVGAEKPSPLFNLLANIMAYLLSNDPDKVLSKRTVHIRQKLNGIIKILGPLFLSYQQVFENRNALLGIDEPDIPISLPNEPVIWCSTHGFKDDVLATVLASRHAYLMLGSLPAFYNTFDGITAFINGVLLCNRKIAASRHASVEKAKRVMALGADLLIFPEGVWNKTPDKLMLDLWAGAYRIAKETGYKIVPVAHYLRDPHGKRKGNPIHTVVADPISMEGLSQEEGLALLRDTLATWHYLLIEQYGKSTRSELIGEDATADEAWGKYLDMHTGAVKYYDREIELVADFRPKGFTRPEDAWHPVAEIRSVTPKNAKHVLWAREVVKERLSIDFQRRY